MKAFPWPLEPPDYRPSDAVKIVDPDAELALRLAELFRAEKPDRASLARRLRELADALEGD